MFALASAAPAMGSVILVLVSGVVVFSRDGKSVFESLPETL